MADTKPDPIKDGGKFTKTITPPATSKINIVQFSIDINNGVILVNYQTGDDLPGGFKVSSQKEIAFRKEQFDANGVSTAGDEFTPLYATLKIDINGLIAALQQKL